MAEKQTDTAAPTQQKEEGRQQRQSPEGGSLQARQSNRLARRDVLPFMSPFALLQRFFTDDVASLSNVASFEPQIDLLQRGNELVVRADLPGVRPDDVVVEVGDDALTISGERQQERVDENGGIRRVERTYGAFFRKIPLPEGAIADQAKANFNNGVLEVTVPAPPDQVQRGRRLEITRQATR